MLARLKNISRNDWLRAIAAVVIFVVILNVPKPPPSDHNYQTELSTYKGFFTGQNGSLGDLFADVVSSRQILQGKDPYVVLGPEFAKLGIAWDVKHPNTHPPTTFFFVMPIAYMPFNHLFFLWSWLMLALLFASAILYGFRWSWALLITSVSLLWIPIVLSFAQLNMIWIFGAALAYRFRNRNDWLAGLGIILGSFVKLFPAILLIPFLLKKRFRTIILFVAVWLVSMGLLWLMYSDIISTYLAANKVAAEVLLTTGLNSSIIKLVLAYGKVGIAVFGLFIASILWVNKDIILKGKEISTSSFMLFSWLSVVLLPLAWPYSLAPLMFVFIYHIMQYRLITTTVAIISVILPCTVYSWGSHFIDNYRIALIACGLLFLLKNKYLSKLDLSFHKIIPGFKLKAWE